VAVRTRARDDVPAAEIALDARVVSVGVWLFLAADLFFFAGWWFAFFYLRALNNNKAWIIDGLTRPNRAYGIVVLLLAIGSAATFFLISRVAPRTTLFRLLSPVPLLLGLAACLFQGYGMWHLGFGLTEGGYPSVFSGLTGSWLIQLLFAVGWLATVVAQSRPAGDTIIRPHSAASFGRILVFLAAVGVINYLLLYLVA
jgi:heme/copper-type cytochrome/quinol oxidase subunit 3